MTDGSAADDGSAVARDGFAQRQLGLGGVMRWHCSLQYLDNSNPRLSLGGTEKNCGTYL